MLTQFLCGSGGCVQDDGEVEEVLCTGPRRKSSGSNKNKNPYSTRGLDKFASVVAHLEEKKHMICRQTKVGSEEMLLVRFRCCSGDGSRDWLPIVVKLGERKSNQKKTARSTISNIGRLAKVNDNKSLSVRRVDHRLHLGLALEGKKMMRLVLVVLLVLMLMALCLLRFGRSFGVMSACVSSYLVPLMKDKEGRWRKTKCKSLVH